jgi:protein TonB
MKTLCLSLFLCCSTLLLAQHKKTATVVKEDTTIYTVADKMPEFPGGRDSLDNYIAKHAVFAAETIESCVMGRSILQFIVEKDGSLSNIIVVREVDYGVDKVAVSVFKRMPHWIPGEREGKKVRVKYTFPFGFRKYLEMQFNPNNKN